VGHLLNIQSESGEVAQRATRPSNRENVGSRQRPCREAAHSAHGHLI